MSDKVLPLKRFKIVAFSRLNSNSEPLDIPQEIPYHLIQMLYYNTLCPMHKK